MSIGWPEQDLEGSDVFLPRKLDRVIDRFERYLEL